MKERYIKNRKPTYGKKKSMKIKSGFGLPDWFKSNCEKCRSNGEDLDITIQKCAYVESIDVAILDRKFIPMDAALSIGCRMVDNEIILNKKCNLFRR